MAKFSRLATSMLLMRVPHNPLQNHILNTLPTEAGERLFPHLEWVQMPLGDVLYESGDELRFAYFLTTSIVSLLYVMENGASLVILIGVLAFSGCFSKDSSDKDKHSKRKEGHLPNLLTKKSERHLGTDRNFKVRKPPMAKPLTKKK